MGTYACAVVLRRCHRSRLWRCSAFFRTASLRRAAARLVLLAWQTRSVPGWIFNLPCALLACLRLPGPLVLLQVLSSRPLQYYFKSSKTSSGCHPAVLRPLADPFLDLWLAHQDHRSTLSKMPGISTRQFQRSRKVRGVLALGRGPPFQLRPGRWSASSSFNQSTGSAERLLLAWREVSCKLVWDCFQKHACSCAL